MKSKPFKQSITLVRNKPKSKFSFVAYGSDREASKQATELARMIVWVLNCNTASCSR